MRCKGTTIYAIEQENSKKKYKKSWQKEKILAYFLAEWNFWRNFASKKKQT